jgi:hypothetical protein
MNLSITSALTTVLAIAKNRRKAQALVRIEAKQLSQNDS